MQRALQPHALQPAGVHPVESMRRVPSMPPSYIDMITRQVMRDPVVLKVRRTSTTCDMQQAAYTSHNKTVVLEAKPLWTCRAPPTRPTRARLLPEVPLLGDCATHSVGRKRGTRSSAQASSSGS